ncbi:30S ribosomal protein S5 [Patescibacteria group bacterium]|nr:30S ribosomal protein S5 [Patescibacteria group bacterium]
MAEFVRDREKDDIEERVIQIDRITRVVKGGRRLRFRAIVTVGDGKGRVGLAVDKSSEVVGAIQKATRKARKNMISVNLDETTIPHEITAEFAGAKVFLKPAQKGTGVIAGGAVRPILEVAGIKDILSKIQGSSSKLNNSYATIEALKALRKFNDDVVEKKEPKKAVIEKKAKKEAAPKAVKIAKEKGAKDESSKPKKTSKK